MPVASAWSWFASGALAGGGEQLGAAQQRAPLGEELLLDLGDEPLAERVGARRLAERGRGLERVEARVGKPADDPDLLDRCSVHLLDLLDQHRDEVDVGEPDRELVDDDALVAFEHVDADDVAADGTDAGRHESQSARAVREPDAHQHVC